MLTKFETIVSVVLFSWNFSYGIITCVRCASSNVCKPTLMGMAKLDMGLCTYGLAVQEDVKVHRRF